MTPPKGYRLVRRGRFKKGDLYFYKEMSCWCNAPQWERLGGMEISKLPGAVARKTAKRGKRK